MDGWKWYSKAKKANRHLGVRHEVYESAEGAFEAVYEGFRPTGLSATRVPIVKKTEEGEEVLQGYLQPVVDASKGKLAGSKGRAAAYQL